jgi:hypothetical protein
MLINLNDLKLDDWLDQYDVIVIQVNVHTLISCLLFEVECNLNPSYLLKTEQKKIDIKYIYKIYKYIIVK